MIPKHELAWDERRFCFGVPVIDRQHKELVVLANAILEGTRTRQPADYMTKAIDELLHLVRLHFDAEESLMAQYSYPGHARHAKAHRRQLADLRHFLGNPEHTASTRLEISTAFLNDWIELHILSEDKEFARFLKDQRQVTF